MIALLVKGALALGIPQQFAKAAAVLAMALGVVGALAGTYYAIRHAGETAGAAKVTAQVAKAHAQTVADAATDTHAAQAVTDQIGANVARSNDKATELVRTTIEDLHHAIDATPAAPAGAPPAPAPVAVMSASINALIDGAERAAEAADAEP